MSDDATLVGSPRPRDRFHEVMLAGSALNTGHVQIHRPHATIESASDDSWDESNMKREECHPQ